MEGTSLTVYKATSDSDPGAYYEVKFYEDGTVECDCPASTFRRAECKHIHRLRNAGAGYKAPERVKVFELSHYSSSVAVVGDKVASAVEQAVSALAVDNELTIKRIA